MLSPPPDSASSENNASCVLQVRARGGTVLLTGDIEADAEQRLLAAHAARLRADVVLAPHHGSSTSSIPLFVEAVAPRYVVYPVGYRNRWRFPRLDVQQRYLDAGAVALRTDRDGAVTFQITDSVHLTETYRDAYRRYWHEQ
jgi:competence protein ComEC